MSGPEKRIALSRAGIRKKKPSWHGLDAKPRERQEGSLCNEIGKDENVRGKEDERGRAWGTVERREAQMWSSYNGFCQDKREKGWDRFPDCLNNRRTKVGRGLKAQYKRCKSKPAGHVDPVQRLAPYGNCSAGEASCNRGIVPHPNYNEKPPPGFVAPESL